MTSTGRLASGLGDESLKWFDSHECSQLNELKMDLSGLNMLAGWHGAGDIIMVEQMPMMGGYAGGPEETAICDVAATMATFALFNGDIHLDGPIHIRWGTTTTRETLKVSGHVATALDYNTDLLLGSQYYTMAGPCTEMCLLETAAQALVDTASGRELLSGVASAKGTVQDMVSPMEARIMGEASMATCGMDVSDINRIVDRIVSRYENNYNNPPVGKIFQECYDVDELVPTDEYLNVYDDALLTLSECGIDF